MANLKEKKILLINPCISYRLFGLLQFLYADRPIPFSLLTLAALTPKDYNVRLINQKNLWLKRDFKKGYLVGITCLTSAASEAYRLADAFRRAGSRVVLGGPHATALPQEALEHADSVVIGEAESVWAKVVGDFESDCLQKIYKAQEMEDFFSPVFDYFLRLPPAILARSGIPIDRGCRYHCDFCAHLSSWLRMIKTDQIVALVKRIKQGARWRAVVKFNSDNVFSNPDHAKELFRKMIPLKVKWIGNASINLGFDEEALELAKASGCRALLVGFDTINPKDYPKTSLKQIHGPQDYLRALKNIKKRGITVYGSFILGFDQQDHRYYARLLWFLMRAGFWFFILTIATPYPGTALFERLKKENRILTFDWRKYILIFCVIRPKKTSIAGLYFWYVLIRALSVFFLPLTLIFAGVFFFGWEFGYRLSRGLLYGW